MAALIRGFAGFSMGGAFAAAPSAAAPQFVTSVGTSAVSSVTGVTTASITPSGSNRLLICSFTEYGQGSNASSVVFNGSENFTLLPSSASGWFDAGGRFQTWYLLNPTATSATVVVTFPGSVSMYAVAVSAFSGVNQSSPFGTIATDLTTTSRTTTTTSPGTTVSDLAYFACGYSANNTLTPDASLTFRQQNGTSGGCGTSSCTAPGAAGSVTGLFTAGASNSTVSIGIAIKP